MLEKLIFRTEVKEILLGYIQKGNVRPGERISLPKIAAELKVSGTPIREALTQLSETGIVTYIANRGFFVTELSQKEAKEINDLMALLEGEAVNNSTYTPDQLVDLAEINAAFQQATDPRDKLNQDRLFHQKLIETYPNAYAHKIIEDLRIRISVYEHQFMGADPGSESVNMHKNIIRYLTADNKDAAVQELRLNWRLGIEHIVRQ